MAFNDTLFQLGMDLTRSSPAQKEDLHASAQGARAALEDTTEDRGVGSYAGRHLIVDLFGARKLDDIEHVERTLKKCVEAAGATLLHMHLHPLKPTGGVTGVAVLAESHISIHSWPESGYAALDVFMSGTADPARTIPVLQEAFGGEVRITTHHRGAAPGESGDQIRKASKPAASARPRAVRKAKAA
ncbi:adenosylmethionine decarboxylase [Hyphomicrobium sp. LHD-15]|uniref:adenosylmethionine decarboxylase n=1 Tax=Hyphomicrobium sp. LHD-15 TaxID=3072142 RepID=UPI00280F96A2|nr:adenosylmethionine decarboxylase [Hyphomicrobium sp. LHD-15]MDQ8698382.1 adenosylmethionine decarboxylase [Hyphomicrobium sp. LHD-15]